MKTIHKAVAAVVRRNGASSELLVFRHPKAGVQLPKGTVESLLEPENKDQLAEILKYHVIPGRVYSDYAASVSSARPSPWPPIDCTRSSVER